MSSLRNVTLIGGRYGERKTIVCEPAARFQMRANAQLWGGPPSTVLGRRIGSLPGEVHDGVRIEPRIFAVPLLVQATSEQDVDDALQELAGILDPTCESPCRIVYQRPDGSAREIFAWYESGGARANVRYGESRYVRVPLVFKAQRPYWRSTTDSESNIGGTIPDAWFASSLHLQLTNPGDVDTWPRWQFAAINGGTMRNIEVFSLDAGRSFRLPNTFAINDVVHIDTDPRAQAVELNADPAYQNIMDPISQFFPLRPGVNDLIVRARGDFQNGAATGILPEYQVFWRAVYQTC